MTIISRRENEGLVIGNDLIATVLEIHPDRVRLGFRCSRRRPTYWEETVFLAGGDADDEFEDEPTGVFLEA